MKAIPAQNIFQDSETRLYSIRGALWVQLFLLLLVHVLIFAFIYSHQKELNQWLAEGGMEQEDIFLRVTTENINEDQKRKITPTTRLSKKDSQGKGKITRRKGLNYLSPHIDFELGQKGAQQQKADQSQKDKPKAEKDNKENQELLSTPQGHFTLALIDEQELRRARALPSRDKQQRGKSSYKIPEFYQFKKKMALNISNDNRNFSFNTARYKDYKYFQDMKRKIQKNWRRNMPSGGFSFNSLDSGFYPGYNQVIPFKSGSAKIAFLIDRQGKIRHIKILHKHPSPTMTQSCYQAIADSKGFGPLPDSINKEKLIIPFQFIYINPIAHHRREQRQARP
jgi:outer membrane biosynthesis protein TonB